MSREIEDLDVIAIPFKFQGRRYLLREASEPSAVRYRAAQLRGVAFGDDGRVVPDADKVHNVYEAQAAFVGENVFAVDDAGQAASEPLGAAVQAWPHRHVRRLFRELEGISLLSEKEASEDTAKNSPGATAATSA